MHVMAKVPIVGVKNFLLNEVMRWKNAMRPMRSRGKYCFFMGVKYYMDYMAKVPTENCFLWGSKRKSKIGFACEKNECGKPP